MKSIDSLLIIVVAVAFASLGQVYWKLGMNLLGPLERYDLDALKSIFFNHYILLGLAMYGTGTIFWLIALSKRDLSFVYPFISLTYVFVLILSSLVLHESIGIHKIAGTIAIIAGLVIIMNSP